MVKKAVAAIEKRVEVQPWDRQEKESLKAFEKFRVYRDTKPSDRSHASLAQLSGVSKACIDQISRRDGWQGRVAAYDQHVSKLSEEAHIADVLDMQRRHRQLGKGMQAVAGMGLARYKDDKKAVAALTPRDLARLADVGTRVERLTYEEMDAGGSAIGGVTVNGPAQFTIGDVLRKPVE
jgi:hypothetical protein